jgi:SAM-dependent methyltransferase
MTDRPAAIEHAACQPLRLRRFAPDIPAYLKETYTWAYLSPRSLALLDRPLVVSAILWGNYRQLLRATLGEVQPGQRVMQPACVYGDFSPRLAAHIGPDGYLEVADVAPIQVANCRRKLKPYPQAAVRLRDAADAGSGAFDAVCCFFLLHELPDAYKRAVVDALLDCVGPGGKAVFVDYHRPHLRHPLKPVMNLVFETLEPFAKALWTREIRDFAGRPERFAWTKRTFFGGMYQMAVARRLD